MACVFTNYCKVIGKMALPVLLKQGVYENG